MSQTNKSLLCKLKSTRGLAAVACPVLLIAGVGVMTFPGCSGGSSEPRGQSGKPDSQQLSSEPPRGGSPETGTPPAQDGPDAYCERASAYYNNGDSERALAVLNEAIQLYPHHVAAYAMRGDVYSIKGDRPRAIEDYTVVIRMAPDHGHAYEMRGLIYREQGDMDSAIQDAGQAIRCLSDNADAFRLRARSYADLGQYDKAIADLREAIRLHPTNPTLYGDLSVAYSRKGDLQQTLACLTEAIRLEPRNPDFFGKRGSLFRKLGNAARAEADFAMAARLGEQLSSPDGDHSQESQSQDRPTRRPSQPASAGGWSDPNAPNAWNDAAAAEEFIRENQASRSGAVNATRGKQQREESHATDAEKRLAKRMADLEQRRSEREQKILGMADSLSEDQIAQLRSQALAEYQAEKQTIVRQYQADNLRAQGASAEVIRSVLEGR